jgi:hypothetical protein
VSLAELGRLEGLLSASTWTLGQPVPDLETTTTAARLARQGQLLAALAEPLSAHHVDLIADIARAPAEAPTRRWPRGELAHALTRELRDAAGATA